MKQKINTMALGTAKKILQIPFTDNPSKYAQYKNNWQLLEKKGVQNGSGL
jgi:hypothetical protein